MKKHWTSFLAEAGTIVRMGFRQQILQQNIKEQEEKLARMQSEFDDTERSLRQLAEHDWTKEEINQAINEALQS